MELLALTCKGLYCSQELAKHRQLVAMRKTLEFYQKTLAWKTFVCSGDWLVNPLIFRMNALNHVAKCGCPRCLRYYGGGGTVLMKPHSSRKVIPVAPADLIPVDSVKDCLLMKKFRELCGIECKVGSTMDSIENDLGLGANQCVRPDSWLDKIGKLPYKTLSETLYQMLAMIVPGDDCALALTPHSNLETPSFPMRNWKTGSPVYLAKARTTLYNCDILDKNRQLANIAAKLDECKRVLAWTSIVEHIRQPFVTSIQHWNRTVRCGCPSCAGVGTIKVGAGRIQILLQ